MTPNPDSIKQPAAGAPEPMTTLEAAHLVDPAAMVRARRLQCAVAMLQEGRKPREASGLIFARFKCSRSTAHRTVGMAADLVLMEPRR